MELNFRFGFPNATHPDSDVMDYGNRYDLNIVRICELYRAIKHKYSHIKWNAIDAVKHGSLYGADEYGRVSPWGLITIENPNTGKFMAINDCDTAHYIHFPHFKENCIEFFAISGTQQDTVYYQPHDVSFTPIVTMTNHLQCYRAIEKAYQENQQEDKRRIPDKLYWRGGSSRYLFRLYIEDDDRFEVNPSCIDGYTFIQEINRYNINIDINSIVEISARTYDIMGLGSALIRPTFQTTKFHNPLIPNYHYAALELNIKDFGNYKLMADAYIDKFEELKKDPDYVKFLSKNGRKWYEQNCIMENYLDIMTTIIDPNKLLM